MIIPAIINKNYAAPTLIADYTFDIFNIVWHIADDIIELLGIQSEVIFTTDYNHSVYDIGVSIACTSECTDQSGNILYMITAHINAINRAMCECPKSMVCIELMITIAHELRHIWQYENNMYMSDYIPPDNDDYSSKYTNLEYEVDADNFALEYVNQYSKKELVDMINKSIDRFISMQSNIALHLDIHSFLLYIKSSIDHHKYIHIFPTDGSPHDICFVYHYNTHDSYIEYIEGVMVVHYDPMRFITDIGNKRDIPSIARSIATTLYNIFQEAYGDSMIVDKNLYIDFATNNLIHLLYAYFTDR